MNPLEHLSYGGGAAGTVLHPLVAAAMVIVIILTFALPRKYVVTPLLFSIFLIPYGQEMRAPLGRYWRLRCLLE